MAVDLDTFLTTVYAVIDELVGGAAPRARSGPVPRMSDSEVLALVVIGQFRGSSERAVLRWAQEHLRPWFPVQLSQSAFNRRARRLALRLTEVMRGVARVLDVGQEPYEVVDCLAVPLAQRCRGDRHRCFPPEEANVGRGGVGKVFYYGTALLLSVAASGPITGFVVAPAHVEERWLLGALLTWRVDPTALPMDVDAVPATRGRSRRTRYVGPAGRLLSPATAGETLDGWYLADRGFAGQAWQQYWAQALRATVWTPDRVPAPLRHWFHHARQIVETINGQLTDVLHIRYPRAHTHQGVLTRIAAKCAALNLGILINRTSGRPDLALGTLFNG